MKSTSRLRTLSHVAAITSDTVCPLLLTNLDNQSSPSFVSTGERSHTFLTRNYNSLQVFRTWIVLLLGELFNIHRLRYILLLHLLLFLSPPRIPLLLVNQICPPVCCLLHRTVIKRFHISTGIPQTAYYSMYSHNADGVGESGALLPASDNNDRVTLLEESAALSVVDAVLHTDVHVLQPVLLGWLWNANAKQIISLLSITSTLSLFPKQLNHSFTHRDRSMARCHGTGGTDAHTGRTW